MTTDTSTLTLSTSPPYAFTANTWYHIYFIISSRNAQFFSILDSSGAEIASVSSSAFTAQNLVKPVTNLASLGADTLFAELAVFAPALHSSEHASLIAGTALSQALHPQLTYYWPLAR